MKNTSFILLFFFLLSMSYAQEEHKKTFEISSFNISLGTSNASLSSSKTDYLNLKGMVDNPELFVNPDDFQNAFYHNEMGEDLTQKFN